MYKSLFLAVISFISTILFAQKENPKIPSDVRKSPELLANYLTQGIRSDSEQVDTIYTWITNNIAYDYDKFSSGDMLYFENTSTILKSKEATCSGYSNLFVQMLNAIDIPAHIVEGYVPIELRDSVVVPTTTTHCWVAYYSEGEWQLADPTWDAGYIGGIPTNKEEKFEKLWRKHNLKFDKKEAEILKLIEENEGEEEKYIHRMVKCKDKRSDKAIKLARKQRKAPDFTGNHGFVSNPGRANYKVSLDSFLVKHLPANPMWQLRTDTISVSTFSRIQNTVASIEDDGITGNLDYESEIRAYYQLDFFERLLWDGVIAQEYYPKNYSTMAVNNYNRIKTLTDEEFQAEAPEEYKMDDFKSLIPYADTLNKQAKLAKSLEKENYKVIRNDFKATYKLERASWKDQTKLIEDAREWNEETIEDIEKNLDKLKDYSASINKLRVKLAGKPTSESLGVDVGNVKELLDSFDKIRSAFDRDKLLWEQAMDSTYLQAVKDTLWQCVGLIDAKNFYLEVKNYTTYKYIEEVDRSVERQLNFLSNMYSDSLPIEYLDKRYYSYIKEMNNFLGYADQVIQSSSTINNKNRVRGYFNQQVIHGADEYLEMTPRAFSHNRWMKGILKEFNVLFKDAEKNVKDQEDLIEERYEFIMDVILTNHERDEKTFQEMRETAKEWKKEFKEG